MPKISKIDPVILKRLYEEGLGLRRLSRHFKMSSGAIDKKLKQEGFKTLGRGCTKRLDRGICLTCERPITSKHAVKFCSKSCSVTHSNVVVRAVKRCPVCQKRFRKMGNHCSASCGRLSREKPITEEIKVFRRKRRLNAVRRYQAKRDNQIPFDANFLEIKNIYLNCPEGYEVDHRIPVSRGGFHHQNNLWYLPKKLNRRKSSKLLEELKPALRAEIKLWALLPNGEQAEQFACILGRVAERSGT